MKSNGRYEAATLVLLPSTSKLWSEGHVDLLSAACEVDRLTDRIVEDSKYMARKFESYATEVAIRHEGWDPTGYSTIRDISMNTAKLECARRHFNSLLRLIFGKDAVKAFFADLNAADKTA